MSPPESKDSEQESDALEHAVAPDSPDRPTPDVERGMSGGSGEASHRIASSPTARGRGSGVIGIVLAAAFLSAILAAAGIYVAVVVTRTGSLPAAPGRSAEAQVISLTQSEAIVLVAAEVRPSVVTITAAGITNVTPFSVPASGAGSGFVVTADGLILTNYHVVAGASSLTVTLDDTRTAQATVVETDPQYDLALIKVAIAGLTPVPLGDSGTLRVGQLAIAIGSPLGTLTDSVTQGVVSGVDRTVTVADRVAKTEQNLSGLIQTDAAINAGNSGGPLLDAGGSVVGVITASVGAAEGMGFAVPINRARELIAAATK